MSTQLWCNAGAGAANVHYDEICCDESASRAQALRRWHGNVCRFQDEVRAAAACARACKQAPGHIRFNSISLKEPAKAELLAFGSGGQPLPRQAALVLQAPPTDYVAEAVVDLASSTVVSWKQVKGAQPMLTPDDCNDAEEIAKADAQVQQLLKARGITDFNLVVADPWSVHLPPKGTNAPRLIQTFMYLHAQPADNAYARPLDFVPVVDLNARKVVHIDLQHGDKVPELPDTDVNYHSNIAGKERPWRTDLKPLNIVQPEGPSFKVDGNLVTWQKWRLRIGFNFKEGLVLHDVGYEDGGRLRPIMHRGSLVEMIVPYGDPNPPFERKCALDTGDYGLGFCANSLELGCDCVGNIHYFDGILSDAQGEPYVLKKAVCMHETDAGTLWKHTEYRTGHAEVRRSRQLEISFIATVVNYEYKFIWTLSQDGSIGFNIQLTGELSTSLLSPGEEEGPKWGTLVAPRVNAQVHQHMFCARLDMAVDDPDGGKGLLVSEVDLVAMPEGPGNPHGNGFWAQETPLMNEAKAARTADPAAARAWKISNPAATHPVTGKPVAYKLVPASNLTLLASPSSMIAQRGGFAQKNLWVTPHSETERFPSSNHTVMSEGGTGLPTWVKQGRDVGPGNDPVLWHCFGVSHLPRPEDFPVMPVEQVGFMLKAQGFFDINPSTDVPPVRNAASTCCGSGAAAVNGTGNSIASGAAANGSAANGIH